MDLSIVVPLYNEVENVEELYSRIKAELGKLSLTYEVIFIDDGSTDGTKEKIKELKKDERELKLIVFRKNYGQTEAMVAGFKHARGDIIVTMDGDLQNDPADIVRIILKLRSGYDLVCGWRQARKDNLLLRKIPSMLGNAIISFITKVRIHDLGCSLKGFRKEIVEHLYLYSEMHRFIPIVAASIGARITEVEVTHRQRVRGKSKYGLSRSWKVLLDIIKIKTLVDFSSKPAKLFTYLSIPFWFFGAIFMGTYLFDGALSSSVVLQATGVIYLFLAFSLSIMGYLAELIVKSGDYRAGDVIKRVIRTEGL